MPKGPFWTTDEDDIIRSNYGPKERQAIETRLPGRTWSSIIQRALKLGIARDPEWRESGRHIIGNGRILDHLSEAEKGYIAGLLDGEGTIGFYKRRNGRKSGNVFVIQISIANTSVTACVWLNARLPGNVYKQTPSPLSKKKGYNWSLAGTRQCLLFLREIEPYLVIKRDQAVALLGGYIRLSVDEREALVVKLSDMKRAA